MHAAVTVLALGHIGVSRGRGLGVDAMIISRLLVGVTGGAYRLGRSWIVRESPDVGMAVGAAEHAVDRRLELRIVHMQADLLAVFVFGQGHIAVAGQTLVIAHLGGGFGRRRMLLRRGRGRMRGSRRTFGLGLLGGLSTCH